MSKPLIVTGHGRSGTHWLAHVLGHFVDARHEPTDTEGADIVVDCRLALQLERFPDHKVVHLVRDGRDVVRSTYEFYHGHMSFEECCDGWAQKVDACREYPFVRLEDLVQRQAGSRGYRLSHWRDWPEDYTQRFWDVCGGQMLRHGYTREG